MKEISIYFSALLLLGISLFKTSSSTCQHFAFQSRKPQIFQWSPCQSQGFPVSSLIVTSIYFFGFAEGRSLISEVEDEHEFLVHHSIRRRATDSEAAPSSQSNASTQSGNGSVPAKVSSVNVSSSNTAAVSSKPKEVKQKTLIIPDRSPANMSSTEWKEEKDNEETDHDKDSGTESSGLNKEAMKRAIIVIAGIVVIIVAYLGTKLFLKRQRKIGGRYGIVETSEMDLLDKIEDDEEESEEEELFDINRHRRHF